MNFTQEIFELEKSAINLLVRKIWYSVFETENPGKADPRNVEPNVTFSNKKNFSHCSFLSCVRLAAAICKTCMHFGLKGSSFILFLLTLLT